MQYLSVRNWDEFQHYKDRSPPWIKLHRSLLNNYEFQCLQDASKAHLIGIWLLASQMDNRIPYDANWIAQRIASTDAIDLTALINGGFLLLDGVAQVASIALAKRSPETEAETEREAEREARKASKWGKCPEGVDETAWTEWVAYKGGSPKRQTITKLANLLSQYSPETQRQAVNHSVANGYAGLFPEKFSNENSTNGNARHPVRDSITDKIRRLRGEEGVGVPDGDVRGEVFEGVWRRT